jgi:pyruvate formate lyase activating enzyme
MYKLTHLPATPVSVLNKARTIALDEGLKYVYIGNVPGTDAENTYCPNCKEIVIERKGFRIIQNNLVDGKCKNCNTPIAGVW